MVVCGRKQKKGDMFVLIFAEIRLESMSRIADCTAVIVIWRDLDQRHVSRGGTIKIYL
jgi:hypothetical protein